MAPSEATTGRQGERAAARHLTRRGWRILARNWRGGGGEIDVVAHRGGVLAICEVKTRRGAIDSDEHVTPAQRERIRRAAAVYMSGRASKAGERVRFDLILVTPRRHLPGWTVTHRPGALDDG